MKHCPNPECSGLAMFKIVSEYNDTSTVCADCETPLVDGPAPDPRKLDTGPKPDPDIELVPLVAIGDEHGLALVEGLLESAGIPYLARGKHIQDLFGFGRLVAVNPITGPVEIHVRSSDLAAAREILEDIGN